MPQYVDNASYIEPLTGVSRIWLNEDPDTPMVAFGDHVSISGSAGPIPIAVGDVTYEKIDDILVDPTVTDWSPGEGHGQIAPAGC